MDLVDKGILFELAGNCRISYQALARKFELTVNAIKKRVNKLIESGVIVLFKIELSWEMLDADPAIFKVSTDGSEEEEVLIDQIGNHRFVSVVGRYSNGKYAGNAEVPRRAGHYQLGQFLRKLDGVTDASVIPAIPLPSKLESPDRHDAILGNKVVFTQLQLRVLRCVTKNPRMPIAEIADLTGLTPRRVRKVLRELQEGGGVTFTVDYNPNVQGGFEFIIEFDIDESKAKPSDIVAWFEEKYPLEYWGSLVMGSGPRMLSWLLVDHPRDVKRITAAVKHSPFAQSVETYIEYSQKPFQSLNDYRLEELFTEADL